MQCKFIKPDGTACEGFAMKDDDYCFSHSPATEQEHLEATRKGGEATQDRDYVQLDPIPVEDTFSTACLITDTLNRIRVVKPDGTMDLKVANSVGFLSSKLIECKKMMLFEENLLKENICKDNKVDLATFRRLMQEYNEEFLRDTKAFIDGAQERYEEYKKHKDKAYLF